MPPILAEVIRLLNPRLRDELRDVIARGDRPDTALAEAIELDLYHCATHMPEYSYRPTGRPLAEVLSDWIAWLRRGCVRVGEQE